jgi:thioesterase domain-containing protein
MAIWTTTNETLTRLNSGVAERVLYLPHAIGGTVGFFRPVARRLADVRSVVGLVCHGISPGNEADRTIGEMAQRYVEAIVAHRPEGPYELVGYSMGGFTAVEVAHRLRATGREVDLVGLLDVPPPGGRMPRVTTADALGLVSRAIGFDPPFVGDPGRSRELLFGDFLAEAVERAILRPEFRTEDLARMVDIYEVNARAMYDYRPAPYPGDLHCLFTSAERAERFGAGWREYAHGTVHVDQFDADHFALMHEQHAEQVAGTIRSWLGC